MTGPSERWMDYFGLSTFFVQWLNFLLYKIMDLSFITGNYLWGMMGYLGIRILFLLSYQAFIKEAPLRRQPIYLCVFFLPSLHFWSAGIGKESITLFALAWLLWGMSYLHKFGWQLIPACGLLFLIRPHLGFLALALIGLIFGISPVFALKNKMIISICAGIVLLVMSPILVQYLNISDLSLTSMGSLMDYQITLLQQAGSSVNLASYNQVQRVLTFLFRPLFFDAYHWESYVASIENLIYVAAVPMLAFYGDRAGVRKMPVYLSFGFLFFIATTLIFANSLSNLGIMMRMKSFTIIFMILVVVYLMVFSKES
ncbi:hypothetical protein [Anditalea andensis]|nr:hypothetical protein [Anditalea andensis]